MAVNNATFTRTELSPTGKNYPRFYMENVQDEMASVQNGRPIFREEERVEIIMPGNPYTRPVMKVTDEHRQRWEKEYADFRRGQDPTVDGTPLEEWPRLKRNQVHELKHLGFLSVEHVAAMDDQAVQRVGLGGRALRDLAQAFLDEATRNALVEREVESNARKDAELASQRRQIDELKQLVDRLAAQVQSIKDQPNAVASFVQGQHDPIEAARQAPAPVPVAPSSLAELATSKRGNRPLRIFDQE